MSILLDPEGLYHSNSVRQMGRCASKAKFGLLVVTQELVIVFFSILSVLNNINKILD